MKKYFMILLLLTIVLEASVEVIKASKNIRYKEKIFKSDLHIDVVKFTKVQKFCKPITREYLSTNAYRAKNHIAKGAIICQKNLYKVKKTNRVLFNFGSISIEKDGKIIRETQEYIRVQDENGKVNKIYKDGRDI